MKVFIKAAAVVVSLLIICFSLTACSSLEDFESFIEKLSRLDFTEPTEYVPKPTESAPTLDGYEPVDSRYSYNELSAGQKELYDKLIRVSFDIGDKFDALNAYVLAGVTVEGYCLDIAQIRVVLRAISDDNPYLFWISNSFSHYYDEDNNCTMVQGYSEFSPEEVERMRGEVDAAMTAFFDTLPEGLSAYELERLVHDYIIDTVEYDVEAAKQDNTTKQEDMKAHDVYGALVEHSCVCEGYGKAEQLLLNRLGVECVGLTGMAYDSASKKDSDDEELHLWNAVKLDGEWYNVDPTWDDMDIEFMRHYYFNMSDEIFEKDHTLSKYFTEVSDSFIEDNGTEEMNIFIPECTGSKYNYYAYECPRLTELDSYELEDALYTAASQKDGYFTFYIDPDYLDFDDAVKSLFKGRQYFFEYAEDVNDRLYDYEIDKSTIYYYSDEARGSVVVELKYY